MCKSKNGFRLSLCTSNSFSNRRGNRGRDFAKQEREGAKMDCLEEVRHPLLHPCPRSPASMASHDVHLPRRHGCRGRQLDRTSVDAAAKAVACSEPPARPPPWPPTRCCYRPLAVEASWDPSATGSPAAMAARPLMP
jgi:hypothetical protein